MKYYYFPSTYFGFKGRGYRGKSKGYLVGRGRGGNIEEVTQVEPVTLAGKSNFIEQSALAKTEKSGAPAQIPKKRYDLWKWLGEGKDMSVQWFKDQYERLKNFKNRKLTQLKQWRLGKQKAGKEWIKDKYDRFRNFRASRLNRLNLWRLSKQAQIKGWIKSKLEKLFSSPKIKALGDYIRGTKIFAKATVKTAWTKIKNKIEKLGINIYAYGRATGEVLKDSIVDAIKVTFQIVKELSAAGITLTTEMIIALGKAFKESGWTAYQIAVAINLLRNPHTFQQEMALKAMDWAPAVGKLAVKGVAGFLGGPMAAAAAGYGGGKLKRKGRLRKGSPEAKAYMSYLRSLRRN